MKTTMMRVIALGLGAGLGPGLGIAPAAATTGGGVGPAAPAALFQEEAEQEARARAEEAYRRAREAFARERFEEAIRQFAALREQFPESTWVPDAYYWQAFSQYRLERLRDALALLERQLAEYPQARINREARDLELRIRSLLGQRGDARAAQRALVEAQLALAADRTMPALAADQAAMVAEMALARSAMASEVALQRAAVIEQIAVQRAQAAMSAVATPAADLPQECEGDEIRHAAMQALMQMDSDRALPILRRVLERRDECSAPLRKQAIFVLSQQSPEDAESLMLDVARNDPDPDVRSAAVFWLAEVGSDAAVEALIDILSTSDDRQLQENAIFALSQHESARAGQILRQYALDATQPEGVREKALFWLSQRPDHADAGFLIDLYGSLESEDLKEHVFFSLAQHPDAQVVDWMLERALDPSEPVELRKQALFWAGQHESIDLSRLSGLYQSLDDAEMKEQIIFVYAQRDEPEVVERLVEIARTETDPELRKMAVFWLGQTGDERAIEFLLELVDEPPR